MTGCTVFTSCLLAMLSGPGSPSQPQPQTRPYIELESQTGVELCSPTPRYRLTSIRNASLYLDAPKTHCWVWDDAVPGITLWASRSTTDGLDLPVVIAIRKGDPPADMRRRIIVRVIGGPGASVAPNETYATMLGLLRSGDILVTPAYPGTRHGTYYPEENFSASSERVANWLRELRKRSPDADIVMVGESLGGPIALDANQRAGGSGADQIVLLSPLAYSSDDAERNFTQRRGAEYRDDSKKSVRVLRRNAGGDFSGSWQQVFSTDLFKTYFPKSERATDIGPRLQANAQTPILLVYGTRDWRAGVAVIERLNPAENLRVVKIADMPHEVGEQYRLAVTTTIVDFLDQSRQQRR